MKAYLKNYRQTPRKVRLVANAVRGKSVARARAMLDFLDKKSAPAIAKLIDSALANARHSGVDTEGLIVKKITVDTGLGLKRFRPRSRGRAAPYRKWMSHVTIELGSTQAAELAEANQK